MFDFRLISTNKLALCAVILVIVVVASATGCNIVRNLFPVSGDAIGGGELYPVIQNGKWGFINSSGKIVVQPQFDGAWWSFEDRAAVNFGGKWGFIDKSGNLVINPRFNQALCFSDGLAVVQVDQKYGWIDKQGKWIVEPQYDWIRSIAGIDGLYWLQYSPHKLPSGLCDDFSEGLIAVNQGSNQYYVDKTGKVIINMSKIAIDGRRVYSESSTSRGINFSEGLAAVIFCRDMAAKGATFCHVDKAAYIDKTGKVVIPIDLPDPGVIPGSFSEGLTFVSLEYVDKTGKIVFHAPSIRGTQVIPVGNFSEGMAVVKSFDQWGYIGKTGNIVVEPQFIWAGQFADGLALVAVGNKFGFIDKTGKFIINPQFDRAIPFFRGLAQVSVGDKLGYIDRSGKYVWNLTK